MHTQLVKAGVLLETTCILILEGPVLMCWYAVVLPPRLPPQISKIGREVEFLSGLRLNNSDWFTNEHQKI